MALKQLGKLGQEIFEHKYIYPGEKTWSDRAKAIAKLASSVEKDEDKQSIFDKFYEVVGSGDFVPGGRVIFNSGRPNGQLLNCYYLSCDDSVASIGKMIQDTYKISCTGGGVGFSFSNIRPKGDDIATIKNSAPGSISVMKMINEIAEHVRAGAQRRAALMALLSVTHPDLFEFLSVKLDQKQLNNFNISVSITTRFLEAVENDEDWYFTFNNKKYQVYRLDRISKLGNDIVDVPALSPVDAVNRALQQCKKHFEDSFNYKEIVQIKAKDIWNKILKNSYDSGDPGFFNYSLVNSYTNVHYFENDLGCNPCQEANLQRYSNCCLGSVNLSNFVLEDGSDVDWKRLANAVRTGVRILDNILTVNNYPLEECKEASTRSRRIGLGVMGLHYMLIKLGLLYGSDKSLEFINRLFSTIRDEAYLTSVYLAREKGSFPAFDSKQYLAEEFAKTLPARVRMLIKQHGIRNAVLFAIAPTGSLGMLMEVSTGIEPIFAWAYKRKYRQGNVWKEIVVVDPLFKELYQKGDFERLKLFVGAYDIEVEGHLKTQAEIQKYIDQAISKTINLPSDSDWTEISKLALHYMPHLKGLTFYRAGSKGGIEPLEAIKLSEENIKTYMNLSLDISSDPMVLQNKTCNIGDGSCGD